MSRTIRRVGLGLAARGEVRKAVAYARSAADAGFDSVWVHDSYFERDPVTFLAAIAAEVKDIGIGAGALNPYTRNPVVVAMTLATLDDLAPGRLRLALGSGLPLRLAQMAIPFDDTVAWVSESIDRIRELWAGHRLTLNPAVPPLQPMFQPPHHVPIYIAGYQRRFVELAGEKADGYLARPCESVPAMRLYRKQIDAAAARAGRSGADVQASGYLLCLADESRRAALNRAKREPFVIYMMSVLSDVSLRRAGFARELRDEIASAWRAEEYHRAAELIPDELLSSFILCGTTKDLAHQAWVYRQAGMDLPLLQPVVQDDDQTAAVIEAAYVYSHSPDVERQPAEGRAFAGAGATADGEEPVPVTDEIGLLERVRRKAVATYEIVRPFSFTASVIPVAAGGAVAYANGVLHPWFFVLALIAGVAIHIGTNVVNEVYDVRKGADQITSPRASHAILKGGITEREALGVAYFAFAVTATIGIALIVLRGWPMLAIGAGGLISGYFYTAPPFEYKYHALGVPLVFVMMGPLMVVGSYFASSGDFSWKALVVSLPIGSLVAAILHGNEWRDIADDARAGARTLSAWLGWSGAHYVYLALILGAYLLVSVSVMARALPVYTLLTMFSLPFAVVLMRRAELGASGQMRAISMIDLHTAYLHMAFGALLVAGLAIAALA